MATGEVHHTHPVAFATIHAGSTGGREEDLDELCRVGGGVHLANPHSARLSTRAVLIGLATVRAQALQHGVLGRSAKRT